MLGGVLVVVLGLVACGGSASGDGAPSGLVVRVGDVPQARGVTITSATVAHWMSVIAAEVSTPPGQPEPQVPTPPRYAACIAYFRRYPAMLNDAGTDHTDTAAKHECEIDYQKEKLKALYFLISTDWIIGEASELGVTLAPTEVSLALSQFADQFHSEASYEKYLSSTRATTADMRVRLTGSLLTGKIEEKLEDEQTKRDATPAQRREAFAHFDTRVQREWIARTSCHQGYVVPICTQYTKPKIAPTLVPPSVPLTNLAPE